jgi:hypothetical protein
MDPLDLLDLEGAMREALAAVAGRPASKNDDVNRSRRQFRDALANVTAAHEPGIRALRALTLRQFTVIGKQSDDIPYDVQDEQRALDDLQAPVIQTARRSLESPAVARNLVSHAGDPEVVQRWTPNARALPPLVVNGLLAAYPGNVHADVGGRSVTFLALNEHVMLRLSAGYGYVAENLLPNLVHVQPPYFVVQTPDTSPAWRSCLIDTQGARYTFPERSFQKHRRVDLKVSALTPTNVEFTGSRGPRTELEYAAFEWKPVRAFEML